nr:FAD-dependent monooxygenase [Sphingomonas sp. CDS-1]
MGQRIAIIGGGIGGLTAALLLIQRGFDVHIYERAPQLLELGAGLQLGPNAVRILHAIGLAGGLARIGCQAPQFAIRRWKDGEQIAAREQARFEEIYGVPNYTVHRGELLSLLLHEFPQERVHVSHACQSIADDGQQVRIGFANGREEVADLVIGADGIHSTIRAAIIGPDKPLFSGFCAYRGIIPADRFDRIGEDKRAACWLGPGAHIAHYPISAGALINVVGVVTEPSWTRESWFDQASKAEYLAHLQDWHPGLRAIVSALEDEEIMKWALYDREPLPTWSRGRVVLLGDAAHAMLSFMGQGAAQAIEDGAVLARCLDTLAPDIALSTYERTRRPRASQIQAASRANGVTFHLPDGAAQQERDAAMKGFMAREASQSSDPVFSYNALEIELEMAAA